MPSVGMRRSTRVFGMAKGVDSARILRSGRRLFPDFGEVKSRRVNDGDDWYHPLKTKTNSIRNSNHYGCKTNNNTEKSTQNGWADTVKANHADRNVVNTELELSRGVVKTESSEDTKSSNKMYGNVYSRKRKAKVVENYGGSDNVKNTVPLKCFFRRQRRRKTEKKDKQHGGSTMEVQQLCVLAVVAESPGGSYSLFSFFMYFVLRYMTRTIVSLPQLAVFLSSEPVCSVYASQGIRFLQDYPLHGNEVCKFFAAAESIPLFSVVFSALPECFMCMHKKMHFRISHQLFGLVNMAIGPLDADSTDGLTTSMEDSDVKIPVNCDSSEKSLEFLESESLSDGKPLLHPSLRSPNSQFQSGVGCRGFRRRRSSMRRGAARNSSVIGVRKSNGALVSDLAYSKRNGIPFSSVVSKLRSVAWHNSVSNLQELRPTVVGLPARANLSTTCSASLLVIEQDKCYREVEAKIILEFSDSREWLLTVKKDESTRFVHRAESVMRPCCCNRFTNAIIWFGDENWKLEFPDRRDWFIFKELYKECFDRNGPASVGKPIPVPVVREVMGYESSEGAPFRRPDVYISTKGDEVARAMAKISPYYDLDCEDEEWLEKFNGVFAKAEVPGHVTSDKFESMIDAFEKACYSCPVALFDDKSFIDQHLDLDAKEVVEAVYSYWILKRKQKQSPLLTVFQAHQGKKVPLIPKAPIRKKRSLKRQVSQLVRGCGTPQLTQAIVERRDFVEERNAMLKVEEAKATAKRSSEAAILKRRRAQVHTENADLAIYRAVKALRIAEATKLGGADELWD